MTRMRVASLLLTLAAAVWAQTPPRAAVRNGSQPDLTTAQNEWAQANTVLQEAVRRLNPCSPRLTSLLEQARTDAAALTRAQASHLRAFPEAVRDEMKAGRAVAAAVTNGMADLQGALAMIEEDGLSIREKRRQLPADDDGRIGSLLEKIEVVSRRAGVADAAGAVAAANRLNSMSTANEALISGMEASIAAEEQLWTEYYAAIEAGIRRRCAEAGPQPAVAPSRAKPAAGKK